MPDGVIDLALVGVGPMAAQHVDALRDVGGLRVVSCVSRTKEKADAFARDHGIAEGRTYEQLIRRPQADALWISVSASAMAPVAHELNALQLPMFLEKPVGLSVEESRAARDFITVPHMVGLNRRYYEIIAQGLDLIRQHGGVRGIEVHMPEDVRPHIERIGERMARQWQFANSIHLIDLFRFCGGEVGDVLINNTVKGVDDRSYNALLRFESGATGVYHAQWYAPGGWRLAIYAAEISIVFQPIEQAVVSKRGQAPFQLATTGPDSRHKPGLHGQAQAFANYVAGASRDTSAADLADYVRSVELVHALTMECGFGVQTS